MCTILTCLIALAVPLVGAVQDPSPGILPQSNSTSYLARDNPELISALKLHVAILGQEQQARMDGVIRYIDSISGGTSSYDLKMMQEDYMSTASSIPFMNTADEIDSAREDMRIQTRLFAEETKAQILNYNGSTDAMSGSINASMRTVEESFSNLSDSLWLARDTARLTVFNTCSDERTQLLAGLNAQGVDISLAKNLSEQIDAQRSALTTALSSKKVGTIQNVNSGIKDLNRQFRDVILMYRSDLKIQLDKAAILAIPN
ncbi:MAG: hypothetical protein NTV84_07190 [Methanoregula sp.]|nr:hypothetical protein [Methanoregula sp.]